MFIWENVLPVNLVYLSDRGVNVQRSDVMKNKKWIH
jgi:hypothetical protein